MSRCFASSSKLSAKEYTNKKSNFNMFCDLRNKFIANGFRAVGTTNACLNESGIIEKFNSQNDQLNIKRGFEQFLSENRVDLSVNYIGQQITDHFCSPYGPNGFDSGGNVDLSNNYFYRGPLLTLAAAGDTGQTLIIDSNGTYINRYAEIKSQNAPTGTTRFNSGKKIIYQDCGEGLPIRASGRMQVVVANELPPPVATGFEIIIV